MRAFIAVLVLIFSFQSWTKADDIREFQIEGISIGNSLLDYFTKELIEAEKQNPDSYYNDKEYFRAWFDGKGKFKIYDYLQIHLKTADKDYIVQSIEGKIIFQNNIKDCYAKKNEIIDEFKLIFPNATIENVKHEHEGDPTGNSIVDTTYFYFSNNKGNVGVACYDWSTTLPHYDNLKVFIDTKEFLYWVRNIAWK